MVSPIILTKRKKITLTGQASGAQTDYQVKLDVVYDSDMNADFSDLRFTESDGETLLSAWLESKIDSTSAVIWVKTDTPANSITADIYMYYCNATLGDYWDGDNTFLLFDDFDGSAIDTDKWDSTNVPTVSDGRAHFVSLKDIKSTTAYDFAQPCTSIISMDINAMVGTGNAALITLLVDRNSVVPSTRAAWYEEGSNDRYVGGVTLDWWAGDSRGAALGDSRHEITCVDPSNFKWKVTGVRTFDDTRYELNNYPDCSTRYFDFSTGYSGCNIDLYWIAICKYTADPATVVFGSEETESLTLAWTEERRIILTGGSSGAQTDYQMKLDVVYHPNMESDFSDLRFTESDGTTLLDAWLEEYVSGESAIIWVKTDTPADTVEDYILMHYGNPGIPSAWNGTATFLLFDDFPGVAIDATKWEGTNLPTVADGKAHIDGIKDISSKIAFDFDQPVSVITSLYVNTVQPADTESTIATEIRRRSDDYRIGGGAWYQEGANDRRVYGVSHDWWNGTNTGAATGASRHVMQNIPPSDFRWKVTGSRTFDDTRNETNNYPATTSCYLAFKSYYSTADTDVLWALVAKAVENPATYSLEPVWYDPEWGNRKKITLTGGASGAQTDYQVKLVVAYDSSMKSDFSDLRFADVNGSEINAWMETHTTSTSAVIWVKTDTPANTVDVDIYMYYGNVGALSISDIFDTGLTGSDDFSDGTSRWSERSGSISINSEIASIYPTSNYGGVRSVGTLSSSDGVAIRTKQKYSDIADTQNAVGFSTVSSNSTWYDQNTLIMRANGYSDEWQAWGKSAFDFWAAATLDTDWHTFDISMVAGSNGIVAITDETGTKSPVWSVVSASYYIWIVKAYNAYQTSHITETDWIFTHKYTIAPATYVFGDEESGGSIPRLDLQIKYMIGELVSSDASLLYGILKFVNVDIGYESDLASVDRLQLLQIQVHTESTVNVTLDSQSKFNIDGYVLLDMQRVWTIGSSGLDLSQQYNVLNLAPPSDNQRSYCIEGYVNDDVVRSYNIRFPGGYYCKPAIGLINGVYTPRVIEDLDRKYHNWKVWETRGDFSWKADLFNTEIIEGRAILASVQGDYIRLLTETLEVFYNAENEFYTDISTEPGKTGFDMDGTYVAFIPTEEGGYYGRLPKGTHEESDVGHKLRLDIIADYYSGYTPTFYPDYAETGWSYIFNRGGELRVQGDESSCGHGFYKIDFLIAGNLDTGLDFEILIDGEVEYTLVNLASRGLGWTSRPIILCCTDDCWHCCEDHTHWVVWSWDSNYVCTKLEYRLTGIDEEYGRKRASYKVWGTTDSWTGDPETMNWTSLGSSSISGNWDSTSDELKRVMDIQPMDGCTYILADIRARYTWLDEDDVFQTSYCLDTTVSEPNFFKMQRITLSNVPCLDEAKFRVVASLVYAHTFTRWIELAHVFITRYKDTGYCQQNIWTHFPALYEWKYLEFFKTIPDDSTNCYMRLKLWKPSTETGWFGEYGMSESVFYRSSDITPPSGYESAEWIRWKTWLISTGAYTPKVYWLSVHSECHDVPMDEIDLLQGVTWDAEVAAGTMSEGGIDITSSRLRWCHDINIKSNQPAGSIYVDIDETISTGTPYAGTLVVTDAQYPNTSTFDDLIEYSSCNDDRFTLPQQWRVKADQDAGISYVDVYKGIYAAFYIKVDQPIGVTYVDVDASIPSDTPETGLIIVKDSITLDEVELEYSVRSGDRFTLVNTLYNVKIDQDAGKLYIDVDSTIDTDTPSEGSLRVKDDVLVYTSYSGDRFVLATLTFYAYTTLDTVTATVTPEAYQTLDTVRFPRDCMEVTLPQTGYINVDGDPMAYTSWEKDRFTVPSTPSDYEVGDGVGIGTPRSYTTAHYVEPQCNVMLEGEELAGTWMQIDISGVSTEQVDALVRPAVWLRPDWIAIEIPLNMSWSESVVGKVWSGYCIDQNSVHITSSEGGYLTLISKRDDTTLNIANTSCMVETNGFFQVFMKGSYEDWEFTVKRVTSDRIFDPGYRQYPSGSTVAFEDVVGGYDLQFWVVPPEDICPKSIAHLDSLATY